MRILAIVCIMVGLSHCLSAQAFEGILEYTVIFKHDPEYHKKTLEGFKNLGWSEEAIKPFRADSLRLRYYIKGDSVWTENYYNNETTISNIDFQAGFQAEVINLAKGSRLVLGKTKEIEDLFENYTDDPNWRDKIKVSSWFKKDYSKLQRLPKLKEKILGYKCMAYELPSSYPELGGTDLYWLTEEIPYAKEQVLPYHLNTLFAPQGMIVRTLYTSPKRGDVEHILRRIVPGPIAPILPRLRSLDFGTLDSLQYADERLNQHLQGKVLEQNPIAPDFSFYPIQSKTPINLYSKKDQGKFLLLDLWGTWCGPCLREMPKVQAFQEEHAAVLEVISLNRGDNRAEHVEGFIKKYGMNWSQAYAGNLLNAFLNPKKSVPYAVLLDSEMKVRWTGNPAGNWEKIEEIIRGN